MTPLHPVLLPHGYCQWAGRMRAERFVQSQVCGL